MACLTSDRLVVKITVKRSDNRSAGGGNARRTSPVVGCARKTEFPASALDRSKGSPLPKMIFRKKGLPLLRNIFIASERCWYRGCSLPPHMKFAKLRLGNRGFVLQRLSRQSLQILAIELLSPIPAQGGRPSPSSSVALMQGTRRVCRSQRYSACKGCCTEEA